jgi:hypothetical protein
MAPNMAGSKPHCVHILLSTGKAYFMLDHA